VARSADRVAKAEKELTQGSDELARRRQELPWVRIDREYRFETDEGSASLADLFRGRSQLLVYYFMFGPDAVPLNQRPFGRAGIQANSSLTVFQPLPHNGQYCRLPPVFPLSLTAHRGDMPCFCPSEP